MLQKDFKILTSSQQIKSTKKDKKGLIIIMQKILNKKSSITIENDQKGIKHLYNALTNDANSIFYATSQITKNLIRKAKNSIYGKDKVLLICMIIQIKKTKKLNRYQKNLPLQRNLQKKEVILIIQIYIVLMAHFNYYKQILLPT